MGLGDEIMGAGFARGAAERGRRIAFGDGRRIIWHGNAHLIFAGNPNVLPPGNERKVSRLQWIEHYPGKRLYCEVVDRGRRHWKFKPGLMVPGELYLTAREMAAAEQVVPDDRLVLIEPNTKHQAPNKRWGHDRYRGVAGALSKAGYRVAQFAAGGMAVAGVEQIHTHDFRVACAVLQRARLYVGPEGGLHHAAAALDVPAVVIFGGFISPAVTGYAMHTNIFTGDGLGCGQIDPCDHCRRCMDKIAVEEVTDAALRILGGIYGRRPHTVEKLSQAQHPPA
jgi:ADP-heptose:LPS heptosyltransferase